MLKKLVPELICPACLEINSMLEAHIFREGKYNNILDGVLVCNSCGEWFPIEDGLLELVEKVLIKPAELVAFYNNHQDKLKPLGLQLPDVQIENPNNIIESQTAERLQQKKHFDWYAENDQQTYDEFKHQPLWQALGKMTFSNWKSKVKNPAWILDIGCAYGVSSFPFAQPVNTVIGIDISKGMIRQAIGISRKLGVEGCTSFIVSDGCNLAFKNQVFDYILTFGAIHHLPEPRICCRESQRVLKKKGVHFALENNKSIFRPIFDLMMKLWPIWSEEAGKEPLITKSMVEEWLNGLPVEINSATSVFLPPHLVNLFGNKLAHAALATSDKIGGAIPGLRNNGGISLFEINKV